MLRLLLPSELQKLKYPHLAVVSNNAFNHFAMELEVTALCGQMTAIKILSSPSLRGSVLLLYSSKLTIGQSLGFSGKQGKKSLLFFFFGVTF